MKLFMIPVLGISTDKYDKLSSGILESGVIINENMPQIKYYVITYANTYTINIIYIIIDIITYQNTKQPEETMIIVNGI